MNLRTIAKTALCLSAVALAAVCLPNTTAQAADRPNWDFAEFRRAHASSCQAARQYNCNGKDCAKWGFSIEGILQNEDDTKDLTVLCPVLEDQIFHKDLVRRLNVHVWQASTTKPISAQLCLTFSLDAGAGFYCGPAVSVPPNARAKRVKTAIVIDNPNFMKNWADPLSERHFAWIRIVVPPVSGGLFSGIAGYAGGQTVAPP